MHARRWLTAAAVAAISSSLWAGGALAQDTTVGVPAVPTGYTELDLALGADQPYKGRSVSIQTQWIEGEGANFAEAIAGFEAATGINIVPDSIGTSHETLLRTRIEGNNPPDLAILAQPAAIVAYGEAGKLKEIGTILDIDRLKADHEVSFYSSGDNTWAIPYKVDVKGVVWYPIKAFAEKGYEVPTTWAELIELSDKIVADGGTPWCIGMEAGTATGWQATDWVEEVLLRTAGTEVYDKWITGEVKFNSPEVKAAFEEVGKIFFTPGYVYGGNTAIVATWQGQPMDPMFNDDLKNPGCWMQNIPFWYGPEFFLDQRTSGQPSKYVIGEDIGLFELPPVEAGAKPPVEFSGDALMVFTDRDEVKAVAQFLATPQGIETWVKKGAATSANTSTPLDWYQGYEAELASKMLAEAPSLRFDGGDLMPSAVGSGTFWTESVNWINANGADLEARLQAIDDSWPK